jgi:thiol:disulfide interchange protein DsbD
MIYKKLLTILIFIVTITNANAGFLMPEQAFKTDIQTNKNEIIFTLNLDKSIYIYDELLSVTIVQENKKTNITKQLNIVNPIDYHEDKVHFGTIKIKIPNILIQQITNNKDAIVKIDFQGCSKKGLCYQPMTKTVEFKSQDIVNTQLKNNKSESGSIASTLKSGNVFLILITFFGFGLLLALTPCVFPMIPILSSIIVSHSGDGKNMSAKKGLYLSIVYVLAMSVAYTIAGVIAGIFGANLQVMLQNPIVLIIFSAIFVALAFSMFGYFEIGLPSSWQTKIDSWSTSKDKEKSQGVAGVAIMGFLSALIVGPCVAPPLAGALVYIGQTGDALLGGVALFVMSIGMGMPLLLVGAGAGKYMPKPGGWMDSVSKVFGVVMLGVAIWMIERVILIEVTFALWALLFIGSALYLFRLKNVFAKIVSIILLILGVIFIIGTVTKATNILNPLENISNVKKVHLKFKSIKTLEELENIVANAKQPIMIDFYAKWCISCKELEHTTFANKEVQNKLKNFILLQVDTTNNTNEDKKLLKRFNLFGPPAIIFFNNKKELKNIEVIGYKNSKEFLQILNSEF